MGVPETTNDSLSEPTSLRPLLATPRKRYLPFGKLLDTKGKALIDIRARGRLRRPFGLSELFLEASEPSFTRVPFRSCRSNRSGFRFAASVDGTGAMCQRSGAR